MNFLGFPPLKAQVQFKMLALKDVYFCGSYTPFIEVICGIFKTTERSSHSSSEPSAWAEEITNFSPHIRKKDSYEIGLVFFFKLVKNEVFLFPVITSCPPVSSLRKIRLLYRSQPLEKCTSQILASFINCIVQGLSANRVKFYLAELWETESAQVDLISFY